MDTKKQKRGCNTEVNSEPADPNVKVPGEESAQYMSNPSKGFWDTLKKIFSRASD